MTKSISEKIINQRSLERFLGIARYKLYQARFLSSEAIKKGDLVNFTRMPVHLDENFASEARLRISDTNHESNLDISKPIVYRISKKDIIKTKKDEYGKIVISSSEDVDIFYGDPGISPSAEVKPKDLLKYKLNIPSMFFGVLDVKNQVPVYISTENPQNTFAIAMTDFGVVKEHENNIKRYQLDVISKMTPDAAVIFNMDLRRKIYLDRKKERFFEETTSKVSEPNSRTKTSVTLMDFSSDEDMQESTAMHFHPGDRVLVIITTNKKAGVTLNFAGTAENPDERPDCSVHLQFEKNSCSIFSFDAFTHHEFKGDFVCFSIHPKEGRNLIEAVQRSEIPSGFLEYATIFSSKDKLNERWANISDKEIKEMSKNTNTLEK